MWMSYVFLDGRGAPFLSFYWLGQARGRSLNTTPMFEEQTRGAQSIAYSRGRRYASYDVYNGHYCNIKTGPYN